MAVIQYTGIVNQVRGKLNGSVFNKARNVNTLQRKQQAPRSNVGFQSEARNIFSNAQRSWKLVSQTQQIQWGLAAANNPSRDRFGELVPLSGYNQYIKAFVFATYAGVSPSGTPDTSPAPPPEVDYYDWSDVSWSVSSLGAPIVSFSGLALDRLNNDPGFYAIVDVGLPVSNGVTVYYGRFSFVGAFESTASVTTSMSANLGPRFPMPADGQLFNVRLRLIYVPNGSVVYQEVRSAAAIIT